MRPYNNILIIILALFHALQTAAQSNIPEFSKLLQPVKKYTAFKTAETIDIDGNAYENSWDEATWSDFFVDIEGNSKPVPAFRTRIKMLWDDKYIYFFARMEEPHVWAYYKNHDQIVYHENDFEIFIDPDKDTHHYFEFEFNAQNTLFDLFMTKPYRNGGIPLISWNAPGIKHAVSIEGTLNNPTDKDKGWNLEVAVPFKDLRLGVSTQKPEDGQIWKINFSRVQWQTEIKDGKYQKKRDKKTGRHLREDNWVWSPVGIVNMHFPERWGLLRFSEKETGEAFEKFEPTDELKLRNYLWKIYYKQKHYHRKNGHYAKSLNLLSESYSIQYDTGKILNFELQATDYQFVVVGKTEDGLTMILDNRGKITSRKK